MPTAPSFWRSSGSRLERGPTGKNPSESKRHPATGDDAEILASFRRVRDDIAVRIDALFSGS
jgi:hypothetical protein